MTSQEYEGYRSKVYAMMDEIDRVSEVFRVAGTAPLPDELTWAAGADLDDLHVQLLARSGRAFRQAW
jgi:hypothetical protein